MRSEKVWKLVRVDQVSNSTPAFSILLPRGPHSFGRGIFLDCEDKRVSRQHGRLDVTDEAVTLTALHKNPCFIIKKSDPSTQVLKSGLQVSLSCGDKLGLLPSSHWYELVQLEDPDYERHVGDNSTTENVDDEVIDFPFDEDMQEGDRSLSPSVLNQQNNKNCDELNVEDTVSKHPSPEADENVSSCPNKRAHWDSAQDELANKQARTGASEDDCAAGGRDIKPDINQLNAAMAEGTCTGVDSIADVKQEVKTEPGTSMLQQAPVAPAPPARERCMYGDKCYRRNLQHKQTYSHPSDADWASGECPWGAGCSRRDPRHWRDHTHPAGTMPPPPHAHNRGPATTVVRHGTTFYINAHSVHFHDDHFSVEDSDGESVDYDYEF